MLLPDCSNVLQLFRNDGYTIRNTFNKLYLNYKLYIECFTCIQRTFDDCLIDWRTPQQLELSQLLGWVKSQRVNVTFTKDRFDSEAAPRRVVICCTSDGSSSPGCRWWARQIMKNIPPSHMLEVRAKVAALTALSGERKDWGVSRAWERDYMANVSSAREQNSRSHWHSPSLH